MDFDFNLFMQSKDIKFRQGYCYTVIQCKTGYQFVKVSKLSKREEDKGETFIMVDPLLVKDLHQFDLVGLPDTVQVTRFVAKQSQKEWFAVRQPAPRDKAETEGEGESGIPFETEDLDIPVEPKKEEKPKPKKATTKTRKEKREDNPLSK